MSAFVNSPLDLLGSLAGGDAHASVSCSIEVYPFEGGPFTIQGGLIRSLTIEKNLRNGDPGIATIELAPGGPFGTESSVTWQQIMTPMSHVVIGMTRGQRSGIVLDGVVLRADEGQQWRTTDRESAAMRRQVIQCADFGWFFRSFNWFALTFTGFTNLTSQAFIATIDQGLLGAYNPAEVARRWYQEIMAGTKGILANTFVPYANGSRILFNDMVSTLWEGFPNAKLPYGDNFMVAEGSWMDKFIDMLPMPWYEVFVTTAPVGGYNLTPSSDNSITAGTQLSMTTQPLAPAAGPVLVARINPIPAIDTTLTVQSAALTFGSLDMSRWNALPLFTLGGHGFISSDISFSADDARNFYMLNPTAYNFLGLNNANNIPFIFSTMGIADPASVHRYGYKPMISNFRWFYDPQGLAAQNPDIDVPHSVGQLYGRQVSWFHPAPLMARAVVSAPLMPDILIGTRFRYAPYKNGVPWNFYIESIRHRFVYGGESTTTLTLSRGLPTSVYADSSDGGVLRQMILGNAQRLDGNYVVGLPAGTGPGLTAFGTTAQIRQVMGELARVFVTPQAS